MRAPSSSRRRPVTGRSLAVALAVAALVTGPVAAATAAPTSTAQGWWTQTNPGGLSKNPSASDVPADGLLVQGGASSPAAYAALATAGLAGAAKVTLTLRVAPSTATTPGAALELCSLAGSFVPAQGGPIVDAPKYSCTKSVTAAENASAFTFDVTSLVSAGSLAVAILPSDAATRVVLAKPGTGAVAAQPAVTVAATPPAPTSATARATPRATQSPRSERTPASEVPSSSPEPAGPTDVGAVLAPPDLPAATAVLNADAPAPVIAASPSVPVSTDTATAEPAAPDTAIALAPTVTTTSSRGTSLPRLVGGLAIAAVLLTVCTWAFVGQAAAPVGAEDDERPRRGGDE